MSDLLRDAKDEIRRENVENVAKKSWPFLIGIIITAIVAGGGYQLYVSSQENAAKKQSVEYYAAINKLQHNDLNGGMALLQKISKEGKGGFADFAAVQLADVMEEKGDFKGALAAFDNAAKTVKDKDIADLARLRAAYVATNIETPDQIIARADSIIKGQGAFTLLARELKASLLWIKGDTKAAKSEYELLQLDPNGTEGVINRASQALGVINSGGIPAKDLAKTQQEVMQEEQAEMQKAQQAQQAAIAAQQQAANQGVAMTPQQQAAAAAAVAAAGGAVPLDANGKPMAGVPVDKNGKPLPLNAKGQPTVDADGKPIEYDKDGKRVVRLPPGVKLPAGTKIPPNVHVIETPMPQNMKLPPLPKGAKVPNLKSQEQAKSDMLKAIEAERKKEMVKHEEVTKEQQAKIDELAKAQAEQQQKNGTNATNALNTPLSSDTGAAKKK